MTLNEYLKDKSKTEFAAAIGYAHRTALYRLLNGENPSMKVAMRIVKLTKGKVKLTDLFRDLK